MRHTQSVKQRKSPPHYWAVLSSSQKWWVSHSLTMTVRLECSLSLITFSDWNFNFCPCLVMSKYLGRSVQTGFDVCLMWYMYLYIWLSACEEINATESRCDLTVTEAWLSLSPALPAPLGGRAGFSLWTRLLENLTFYFQAHFVWNLRHTHGFNPFPKLWWFSVLCPLPYPFS